VRFYSHTTLYNMKSSFSLKHAVSLIEELLTVIIKKHSECRNSIKLLVNQTFIGAILFDADLMGICIGREDIYLDIEKPLVVYTRATAL
jgi:hypothetical protein